MNQALKAACRRAGLPPLDLDGLRHSGLSLLGEAGVSFRVAADVVGHAGTTITADVYKHSTVALVREGVERAEMVLFSAKREEPPVEPETVGITENAEESDSSEG